MMQNLDIESVKKGLVDLFKEVRAGFESKQKHGTQQQLRISLTSE
jgi:hypothetical protein